MSFQASLLPDDAAAYAPLAERLRPQHFDEFFGQQHLIAATGPVRRAVAAGHLHSMLFWGPPGCGKTTLAKLIARQCNAHFTTLSAVLAGVKEVRAAVEEAKLRLQQGRPTVLFIDEVHRFNKAQQDAFLPHIEDGSIYFLGATTENPSFELNNALLSRVRTYVLKPLTTADLRALLQHALQDARGYAHLNLVLPEQVRDLLIQSADGDARRLLNFLEVAVDLSEEQAGQRCITLETLQQIAGESMRRFDKGGDLFYEQISALHKSIRGSDPDAALYWFCRMLDGGCDPNYIARRLTRIASEDVGNADLRALSLAMDAWEAYRRLGSPEGELALAQVVIYFACTVKSNAVYTAYNSARQHVRDTGTLEVPLHLRNASTGLMKSLDYGKNYRYAHDEEGGFAAGEHYFPESLAGSEYYRPLDRGLETRIAERLRDLRERNRATTKK